MRGEASWVCLAARLHSLIERIGPGIEGITGVGLRSIRQAGPGGGGLSANSAWKPGPLGPGTGLQLGNRNLCHPGAVP